jgi:hypothetical protein
MANGLDLTAALRAEAGRCEGAEAFDARLSSSMCGGTTRS